ncbi:embryonic stem cell-specific 5-hydroxymethylcytosine-binding protein isoform X3 [Carlito syrichta]|uniref:Abasic site processing protein HMCES n=1 Tax=Carlito syrichta TaxID=1868482 RepID=A0A3Q0EC19_CARSF|nr:embryonic stem cell-specific 5-hydroxymethylcytosine-binding protein isoform X3 [Carlito syrichta]
MCGRTSCHLPRDALTRACAYQDRWGQQRLPEWRDPDKYCPSYNKSPQSTCPVLLSRLHFEKVPLGKGRRCVVLADGFYEWQRCQGTSLRQPYFIYFPQIKTEKPGSIDAADSPENWEKVWGNWRLLTMAGIFDCWTPPQGDVLYSYTIITVDSCKSLSDIHQRMPAILDGEEAVSKWLDFGEVSTQEALKLIHPTENITFHPVSSVVNNSRNNTPECLAPVNLEVKKELKASGSCQKMLQWLATKSPKKEDLKTSQKEESTVPQWSSQFLQKSPRPTKRSGAGLLEQWLKREKEEEPAAKRLHSQ